MVRAHPHLLNPRPASLLRLRPVSVISVARELLEPEEEEDRLWQSRIKIINMNCKLHDYKPSELHIMVVCNDILECSMISVFHSKNVYILLLHPSTYIITYIFYFNLSV